MVFLFGIWQRAGLNSLPRPARSASNPEVRQGSHEWLCHSRDAGSESSLVARTKKERHPHGCLSFLVHHFCYTKVLACGRVIEREWGNPSKVSPSHPHSGGFTVSSPLAKIRAAHYNYNSVSVFVRSAGTAAFLAKTRESISELNKEDKPHDKSL